LALCLVATLYLGILPNRVLQVAQHSAQVLVGPVSGAPAFADDGRSVVNSN
jgi:hypothetical protein